MSDMVTVAELRTLVPERCFKPNIWRSLFYVVFDVVVIAGIYAVLATGVPWYVEWPLIFVLGAMFWALFVIGHDAGHGAFAQKRWLNTLFGILTNAPILVPYRGWQRSHALHHMKTGHLHDEEVFRAVRPESDSLFRKVIFRSGIFIVIGWPMYKLGFRNPTTYKPVTGSHFLPTSTLMTKSVRFTWYLGLLAVLACLSLYIWLGVTYGWVFFAKYILAPYLCYGGWLTFVTYMQHVAPEVPVYDEKDWTRMRGALSSVDRNYWPFNWLTHNVGNLHVVHHIFPTIPHYRLKEAHDIVRPHLGEYYLSSRRWVIADFVRTLLHCHFVSPAQGREQWSSAYWYFRKRTKQSLTPTGIE